MTVTPSNTIIQKTKVIQGNSKPLRMRTGTDDFKTLLLNSDVFVDKSLMIKELLEKNY
ncbi:MAG: hypothetical protein LF885_00550 [Rickettsia endosymbiont of Culicoides impunctatus]|nr:MAG: hypothetical protein LF885_00550 [Rickettsia endosymbiont of Culicoides impunctatus]